MKERRIDARKLVNSPARLYHPEHGPLDGVISDISDGGAAIALKSQVEIHNNEPSETPLLLRPINLDVIFTVSYLRQFESTVVVKFLE